MPKQMNKVQSIRRAQYPQLAQVKTFPENFSDEHRGRRRRTRCFYQEEDGERKDGGEQGCMRIGQAGLAQSAMGWL